MRRNLKLLWMLLAITMCSASLCSAQRIVEALPDDSFIVEINGKNYRAIDATKVREIEKLRIDAKRDSKISVEKEKQIAALNRLGELQTQNADLQKKVADSFESDFQRSQTDAARWRNLFMTERDLRRDSQQFIPHGNSGKWAKFLS